MTITEYIESWADRKFSWKDDHCVAFAVGWAGCCDNGHAVEFDKWVEANPAFLKIESAASAKEFMTSIGITCTLSFAKRLADASGMRMVDGHIKRPGLVVVRWCGTGMRCGIIASDYRAAFLSEGGGVRFDDGHHSKDAYLRPRGLR